MKNALIKVTSLALAFAITLMIYSPQTVYAADVTSTLENENSDISVDGTIVAAGGTIDYDDIKDSGFILNLSFDIPVLGDDPDPANPTIPRVDYGDTATYTLTDSEHLVLNSVNVTDIPIYTSTNINLGTVSFTKPSPTDPIQATITFNGDADIFNGNSDNVKGELEVGIGLTGLSIGDTEQNIPITVFGKNYTINIPATAIDYGLTKDGVLSDGKITWTVQASRTQGSTPLSLDGYVFEDNLSAAGTYVDGSFAVGGASATPTHSGNTLSYTFPAGTTGAQTITYQTDVIDSSNPINGNKNMVNTATLNSPAGSEVKEVQDTVTVSQNWISKEATAVNELSGEITWTIIFNHLGLTLQNVVLHEDLSDGEIKAISYVTSADGTTTSWNTTSNSVHISSSTQTSFNLGAITGPIKITVTSETDLGSGLVTQKESVTNTAFFTWQGYSGNSVIDYDTVDIGYTAMGKNGTANKSDGTVDWTVSIDPNTQAFTDSVIYDALIYGESGTINWGSVTSTGATSAILQRLTPSYGMAYKDGSITSSSDTVILPLMSGSVRVGDLIKVTDNDGDATNAISFSYTSHVLDAGYLVGDGTTITNTASLFTDDTFLISAAGSVISVDNVSKVALPRNNTTLTNFTSLINATAAATSASFNYDDQTVVFRIKTNLNGLDGASIGHSIPSHELGDIVYTDTLPTGWEFVPFESGDDYYIYDASGAPADFSSSADALVFSKAIVGGNHTASFTFAQDVVKPYTIFLRAQPTDSTTLKTYFAKNGSTTVTNNVDVYKEGSSVPLGSSDEDVVINSEILSKNHVADESTGVVTWDIFYNPNQQPVIDSSTTLLDTLPDGVDLRTDAKSNIFFTDASGNVNVAIYEVPINADGTLGSPIGSNLADASTVSFDPITRIITFKIPNAAKAYKYTYTTDITCAGNVVAKNNVRFSSGEAGNLEQSSQYDISVAAASASMGRNKYISLITTDHFTSAPLDGAEFTLFSTGVAVINLKGTNSIEITHIPAGTSYTVLLDGYNTDKYEVLGKEGRSRTGVIVQDATQFEGFSVRIRPTTAYLNTMVYSTDTTTTDASNSNGDQNPNTRESTNVYAWAMCAALSLAGMTYAYVNLRKKENNLSFTHSKK